MRNSIEIPKTKTGCDEININSPYTSIIYDITYELNRAYHTLRMLSSRKKVVINKSLSKE